MSAELQRFLTDLIYAYAGWYGTIGAFLVLCGLARLWRRTPYARRRAEAEARERDERMRQALARYLGI